MATFYSALSPAEVAVGVRTALDDCLAARASTITHSHPPHQRYTRGAGHAHQRNREDRGSRGQGYTSQPDRVDRNQFAEALSLRAGGHRNCLRGACLHHMDVYFEV